MSTEISPSEIIDTLGGTAETARLCHTAWQTVSGWRNQKTIPGAKLFLLAYPLEVATGGKWNRKKLFPEVWRQVWPELDFEVQPKTKGKNK